MKSCVTYIDGEGNKKTGYYCLYTDRCRCEDGPVQTICLSSDEGARGYGYSHGGPSYRGLVDAIVSAEGTEKILAARGGITKRHAVAAALTHVEKNGQEEALRRVRVAISRLGTADCDDALDALDAVVDDMLRLQREAVDEANALRVERDKARCGVVWYVARPYYEQGVSGYFYKTDNTLDVETLQVFEDEYDAKFQAVEESRRTLRDLLVHDSLERFCPVRVIDQLSEDDYERLHQILHGEETDDTFHSPFRVEEITDDECDEVLEILSHLKWVVGSSPIKRAS